MTILSDDIGSYPLPDQASKEELQGIAFKIVTGEASSAEKELFDSVVQQIMKQKLETNVDRPNFPQVQDMVEEFFHHIEKHYKPDKPWVIEDQYASIPEIDSIKGTAKKYFEENSKPIELRVCITGPIEIYLKKVGTNIQGDLLANIGESISRYVENSIIDKKYLKTKVISIDEPSLGLNPNMISQKEDLIKALDKATQRAKNLDVQVHLHSAREHQLILDTENISVIGVESAENPQILDDIEKKDLEQNDKFLRVGISRTNFSAIGAEYQQEMGEEIWKTKNYVKMLDEKESKQIIIKRLEKAYDLFGEQIKYTGPDCGLGPWPTQQAAYHQLKNTVSAISDFRSQLKS